MRTTVLGTGRMGTALARRLLAGGHEVTVWNRTFSRTADAVDAGATAVRDATAAVDGAEVSFVSMADDQADRSVVTAELAAALDKTAVLVDCSTVSPSTTRALDELVGGRRLLAAPILGAPQAVESGQSVLLLGGPPATIERLSALWADLAATHHVCGADPGSATSLKLVANYLLLGGLAVLTEAVGAAEAAGIDPAVLQGFLRTSPIVAAGLQNRLENVLGGDHAGWFTPAQGAKDVHLALEMAAAGGTALPVGRCIAERYDEAGRRAGPDDDVAAIVELVR